MQTDKHTNIHAAIQTNAHIINNMACSYNTDILKPPIQGFDIPDILKDLRFWFSNCENVGATNPSNLTQSHTYFDLIDSTSFAKAGLFLKIPKAHSHIISYLILIFVTSSACQMKFQLCE